MITIWKVVEGKLEELHHRIHDGGIGMNVATQKRDGVIRGKVLDIIRDVWMMATHKRNRFCQAS